MQKENYFVQFSDGAICGRCSEIKMLGTTFLKVEVPESPKTFPYTKLIRGDQVIGMTVIGDLQVRNHVNSNRHVASALSCFVKSPGLKAELDRALEIQNKFKR